MQRIQTVSDESIPKASVPVVEGIKKQFGKCPNIFGSMAHSPAALKALLGVMQSMDGASLTGREQEAVALRVGQMHGCKYCSAAHTAKAKMLGVTENETIAWRQGKADDPKLQVLLDLAETIVNKRGTISDEDVQAARKAEISDAELIETVACVAQNVFTNYINGLVLTEVDFPAAKEI